MTDTTSTLQSIAQTLDEEDSYELTAEDDTRAALGLPEEGGPIRRNDRSATLVARGRRDTIPVEHRLYRLDTGDYVHVKVTKKNQGEYRRRYYIKGIGELEVEGRGIDRDDLEDACDDLAIPINDEVYSKLDDIPRTTAEIMTLEADYHSAAAMLYTGGGIAIEVQDRYEGWESIRSDVMEHVDDDDFPAPEEDRDSQIETLKDVKDKEFHLLVKRAYRCIDHKRINTRAYDTDMMVDYSASVDFDASHLL